MKILAIDFGKKRLGFALGDTSINTALPLKQIDRKNSAQDIQYIKDLIAEYDVEKIVIGYPLHMDGSKSKISTAVENFSGSLQKKANIPVDFIDERLTSFEAEELLKAHQPDYRKRKKVLDSISALVILRSYMERK
ncbi:MAG: Holliday junction resolvase RuvX [Candidatus Aminicenantes bacterium]|nr:Holliday junction resolvase RuvX [Candidatus Aminicenantes bacterium]